MSRRGTRRLRRRSRTCSPMGRSIALGRFPKGNEGKTQGGLPLGNPVCLWQTELFKLNLKSSPSSSGYNRRRRLASRSSGKQQVGRTAVRTAPIVCPEESPCEFFRRLRSEGVQGASGKPPACIDRRQLCRQKSPMAGNDAPTPARIGTGRPKGRSHFSFGGERKVCKRKPAARRLREKALYCPFLKEGVRNVARSTVGLPTFTFVRARAHSFPLSKRARLFPSAAYRRSAPPQLAVGRLTPCGVGRCGVVWGFLQRR